MATSLDLSSLYRAPVFRTSSTEQPQRELSRAITDHQIRWGRGRVAAEFHRKKLRGLSLMLLSYGAEVEIRPTVFDDFALVQMPLVGHAEIECDGQSLTLGPSEVALLSPRQDLRLLWAPGCQQIIVKVPHTLVPQAAGGAGPWDSAAFKLPAQHAPIWQALVQQMLALVPVQQQGYLHTPWVDRFEQSLVEFLHAHQPARWGDGPAPPLLTGPKELEALQARVGEARLQRVLTQLREHPGAPLTLAEMARIGGVSARTLHTLCRELRGCTPMELLRQCRLDATRQRLLDEAGLTVTEAALECGFSHLGRFSAYYRDRFGESPTETRQRALARAGTQG